MRINRKAGKVAIMVIAAVLVVSSLFFALSQWEKWWGKVKDPHSRDESVVLDGVRYVPKHDLKTILLVGVDKYKEQTDTDSYNNAQQADFLALVVIDEKAHTYTVLHLNRDTMTEIQVLGVRGEKAGTFQGQLALSHTYGSGRHDSCRNTVLAVSKLLDGIRIDHYMTFTMDAVKKITDMVGGVPVTVEEDMTSVDPAMVKGERITLTGDMALRYVRARGGLVDSTNIHRMERQRQYLKELQKKVQESAEESEDFIVKAVNAVSDYMLSDCTVHQITALYDQCTDYDSNGISEIAGEARKGETFMEFYPDQDKLRRLVVDLFYHPEKK